MEAGSSALLTNRICVRFSLAEIHSATQNFDESLVIGQGGYGKVYKGPINNTIVAIKRLHSVSDEAPLEFRGEVEMLSKLRHCNLVSLIGYCGDGKEMVLVYEYMPHGTLEDLLHKAGPPVSWLQRLEMCIGAARGLDYLHTGTGTQHGVIHRDVKSSNILLDENFAAKISDFGPAKIGILLDDNFAAKVSDLRPVKAGPTNQSAGKLTWKSGVYSFGVALLEVLTGTRTLVSTKVKGTFGYMDPTYYYTGKLTRKLDVYSFGVVLFEVLTGRPAVDTSDDENPWGLAPWAQDRIKEGKLGQIIDPSLKGQISSNCLEKFASTAVSCLHDDPNKRPTMAEIVVKLELIYSLQKSENKVEPVHSLQETHFAEKRRSYFAPNSYKLWRR